MLEVVHAEREAGPIAGVIVQLGGQTPLGLARALKDEGVPIVGTSPEAIHLAEDRGAFGRVLAEAELPAPRHGTAYSGEEAVEVAREIGYPVLVRPSYVLGGRGMEIVYDDETLTGYVNRATERLARAPGAGRPVPRRRDRDRRRRAVRRRGDVPRRDHGAHRGGRDPLRRLGLRAAAGDPRAGGGRAGSATSTLKLAQGIGVKGLMNVQFALAQDVLYVLEANPRASRTVPFVAKATGVPLAKAAARVMLGATHRPAARGGPAAAAGRRRRPAGARAGSVKEAVLPFKRFRTRDGQVVDSLLGPEMRSTGEVMGIDTDFGAGVRQEPARLGHRAAPPRARSSCRSPTATSGR